MSHRMIAAALLGLVLLAGCSTAGSVLGRAPVVRLATAQIAPANVEVQDGYAPLPLEFGPAEFARDLWLDQGRMRSGVTFVEVEMQSPGAFCLEVVGADGRVIKSMHRSNPSGGWHDFYLPDEIRGRIDNVSYALRLVNEAGGQRRVERGAIDGPAPTFAADIASPTTGPHPGQVSPGDDAGDAQ